MDWLGSGLLGDALGVGAGLIGSLFGAGSSSHTEAEWAYWRQRDMLERQYQMSQETMQNKHQWEVQDLYGAGLNPLLSATQATGTLNTPSPGSVAHANPAQSAAAMSQVFANIYSAKKQSDAAMLNARANATQADAAMIRAQNDTTMTNFQIGPEFQLRSGITGAQMDNLIASTGLSNSQKLLNDIKLEWEPKLLQANLDEVQNRIAMAKILTAAQDYALRTGADAQMVSANAAMYHASSYERFVANAEMLGVHEAQLTDANVSRVNGELENIKEDTERKARQNRYEEFNENSTYYRATRHIGDTIDNLLGVSKFFK